MKTTLFAKLFSIGMNVFFVIGLLAATSGCEEKDKAVSPTIAKPSVKVLLEELGSVKTHDESEKAIVHFLYEVHRAKWGEVYSRDQFELNILNPASVNSLATAHLNFINQKEMPIHTLEEIINVLSESHPVKNESKKNDPKTIIKDLENQVNEAFLKPAEPKNLLPLMLAADVKNASVAPVLAKNGTLSPIQLYSLLVWLSKEKNSNGPRPVGTSLPGARTTYYEDSCEDNPALCDCLRSCSVGKSELEMWEKKQAAVNEAWRYEDNDPDWLERRMEEIDEEYRQARDAEDACISDCEERYGDQG